MADKKKKKSQLSKNQLTLQKKPDATLKQNKLKVKHSKPKPNVGDTNIVQPVTKPTQIKKLLTKKGTQSNKTNKQNLPIALNKKPKLIPNSNEVNNNLNGSALNIKTNKTKKVIGSNEKTNAPLQLKQDVTFAKQKKEANFLEAKAQIQPPKTKNQINEPSLDAKAIIHGALFVAGKEGMTLAELHKILPKLTMDEIKTNLVQLQAKFDADVEAGITIKDFGNKYKLLTKPIIKKEMRYYANLKFKNPLNNKLMEVLAIIAYNQPCTRPRISEIRGSDSANLVDLLIGHGLVQELGRADTWGRPFIYAVTDKFFDLFGISSIEELPEVQNFDLDAFAEANFFDSNRFEE